jgi:hypothetical protein
MSPLTHLDYSSLSKHHLHTDAVAQSKGDLCESSWLGFCHTHKMLLICLPTTLGLVECSSDAHRLLHSNSNSSTTFCFRASGHNSDSSTSRECASTLCILCHNFWPCPNMCRDCYCLLLCVGYSNVRLGSPYSQLVLNCRQVHFIMCSIHINAQKQSQVSCMGRGKWVQLQSRKLPDHQGGCWALFRNIEASLKPAVRREVGHSEYAMQALPMLLCETWSFQRCRGQADILHCEGWWYIADTRLRVVCMAVEDVDVLTWRWMNGFPDRRWQHRAWALFDTDTCCCPNPCPCCLRTDCYHQSCMLRM